MPIRVLDAATVGRIAAGEVVERPSSVVKELMENSLDAGASSITVEIRGGGIEYLRVTDNGCGIEAGQVRMAFENHATSKLQRAEQLEDIRTLGFRGEALPSIAAVSRVEMTTRAQGQQSGMKYSCEGGQNIRLQEAGCPQGTTLIMRDLFFNVPVRRAFLKKPSYEGGLVSDAVARLLLGNPDVSVRLINGGKTLYHSFGDGKLRHAVFAVYGRETAESMVELDAGEGGTRIHGLIGVGELAKATRAHQYFFINGRSVRCPLLSRALEQVCRSRVTIGLYPMCVLNLVLPPTSVDVNVHPNKLEVRFRDEEMMRTVCEELIARAFAGEKVLQVEKITSQAPRVERRVELREIPLSSVAEREKIREAGDGAAPGQLPSGMVSPLSKATLNDAQASAPRMPPLSQETSAATSANDRPQMPPLPVPSAPQQLKLEFRAPSNEKLRENQFASDGQENVKTISEMEPSAQNRAPAPEAKRGEPSALQADAEAARTGQQGNAVPSREEVPFRVIGVAFKTYILVEAGDSLLLIDQHAAHERLQYERFMARAEQGTASQQLLTPLIFQLSAREMAVVEENVETLRAAGYEVEPFGESDIRVTAVPFVMGRSELRPLFLEMLQSLNQLRSATVDARRAQVIQMACKSAVKAGDALSESEIGALISDLLETGAPPTCPHGRPVVKAIHRRELEKMFKRIQ